MYLEHRKGLLFTILYRVRELSSCLVNVTSQEIAKLQIPKYFLHFLVMPKRLKLFG